MLIEKGIIKSSRIKGHVLDRTSLELVASCQDDVLVGSKESNKFRVHTSSGTHDASLSSASKYPVKMLGKEVPLKAQPRKGNSKHWLTGHLDFQHVRDDGKISNDDYKPLAKDHQTDYYFMMEFLKNCIQISAYNVLVRRNMFVKESNMVGLFYNKYGAIEFDAFRLLSEASKFFKGDALKAVRFLTDYL